MYTAVKGVYENGKLTFTETPPEVEKSEVVVLFMQPGVSENAGADSGEKRGVTLGSLAGKGYSIPDNFDDLLPNQGDYI